MEARERGAKVIHVDPRFTRTSAMATKFVGIRAGSDIAFLGGIVNYILEHEPLSSTSTSTRYTNAPVIIDEDFRDTEDLDGLFSGWDPETRHLRPTSPGSTRAWRCTASAAEREHGDARRAGRARRPRRRPRARRAARGGRDAPAPALRLPDPEAALPPLHARARRARSAAARARSSSTSREALCDELGPRAHGRVLLRRRLDAAHGRRPVHPHRRDHPAAARQHRAARAAASWRCAGTRRSRARPTSRRCTTSCPATCRCRTPSAHGDARRVHRAEHGARPACGATWTPTSSAC